MTHTSTEQPEALRLAECLDYPLHVTMRQFEDAAAELRRLHARVQELEASQAQRVPLSDAEICDALGIDGSDGWTYTVARHRASPRHHTGEAGMTKSTEQERADFEAAWMESTGTYSPPKRSSNGDYVYPGAYNAWKWWQAARRAPAAPETIEQRAKKLKCLQVLVGATAGVPEAIALARSRFIEAYGRSPLHDDLAYACLLIDAYGGAPAAPVPQGWKLVPDADNMTDEQAEAVAEIARVCGGGALDIYRAALAAAPQPQAQEKQQ